MPNDLRVQRPSTLHIGYLNASGASVDQVATASAAGVGWITPAAGLTVLDDGVEVLANASIINFAGGLNVASGATGIVSVSKFTSASIFLPSSAMFANDAGRSFLDGTDTDFVRFSGTGQPDDAGISFRLPPNFASFDGVRIWWTMDGTSSSTLNVKWATIVTTLGKDEGEFTNQMETIDIIEPGYNGTAWRVLLSSTYSITTTLSANEVLHFGLTRDPGDADDTMTDTAFIYGIEINFQQAES